MEAWDLVAQRNRKPFKSQGPGHMCCFRETMYIDGVSVTVLKTDEDARAGGPRQSSIKKNQDEDCIQKPSPGHQLDNQCVVVHPGGWDLMYDMHESP
jgi:hypothetical protein